MTFTIDTHTWRSPNYDKRPAGTDIWALILHSCEGNPPGNEEQSSLPWLCNPATQVSSHYYVTRGGTIYQLVDDASRAWHAGVSMLNGVWYANDYSIGIELEHKRGAPPYPQVQIDALTWLAQRLIAAYAIPQHGIATHRQVAQNAGRNDRSDPTDISDEQFAIWVAGLYATGDPLRARTLPGAPGHDAVYCSAGAHTFYVDRGGLAFCGYPLRDEYQTSDSRGNPCAILACERIIVKESNGYGTEQALLSEAKQLGWIV